MSGWESSLGLFITFGLAEEGGGERNGLLNADKSNTEIVVECLWVGFKLLGFLCVVSRRAWSSFCLRDHFLWPSHILLFIYLSFALCMNRGLSVRLRVWAWHWDHALAGPHSLAQRWCPSAQLCSQRERHSAAAILSAFWAMKLQLLSLSPFLSFLLSLSPTVLYLHTLSQFKYTLIFLWWKPRFVVLIWRAPQSKTDLYINMTIIRRIIY